MGIIIAVVIYEILSIGGITWYLLSKEKHKIQGDDFISSGKKLTPMLVGITTALALLGSVHIFGIMEMTWHYGAIAVWWGIATVVTICVICIATGRWVRRTGEITIPSLLDRLYGRNIRIACSCIIAVQTFAIMTLETQALGIILHTLTENAVSIQTGAAIGGLAGLAYVCLAGMKEVAWVNVVNTVLMYAGLILAVIFLGLNIPGGWDGVGEHYVSQGQAHMISIYGKENMVWLFALGLVVSSVFAQGISQMGLSASMSAESEKAVRKSLWWGCIVNGMFGIFSVALGLAAKSLVERGLIGAAADTAAKTSGPIMFLHYLPGWLVALLIAGFLGAVLSTFAITTLSLGAIFTKDLYCGLRNPNASPETQTRLTRVVIVASVVVAVLTSAQLPPIGEGAAWVMAWLCPIFWNVVIGLFWQRSRKAAGLTFAIAWIVLALWSFSPLPVTLGIGHFPTSYASLVVTLAAGLVFNLMYKGEKPLFKEAEFARRAA